MRHHLAAPALPATAVESSNARLVLASAQDVPVGQKATGHKMELIVVSREPRLLEKEGKLMFLAHDAGNTLVQVRAYCMQTEACFACWA
jgi:hypothetical protein